MTNSEQPIRLLLNIPQRRLARIRVEGFKSIDRMQTLELAPVTVLAGANSAGKSSMMQPLLLLKQTQEAPFDPGALLLSGDNVRFTSAEQMLFRRGAVQTRRAFAIELETNFKDWIRLEYFCPPGEGVVLAEMQYRTHDKDGERLRRLHPGMSSEDAGAAILAGSTDPLNEILEERFDIGARNGKPLRWIVSRKRFYLTATIETEGDTRLSASAFDWEVSPASNFFSHIAGIVHVPGLRGNPARAYPITAVESQYPGTFERYIASVIHHWQKTGDARVREIGEDLNALGLACKVEATKIDDTQVQLQVDRLCGRGPNDPTDMVNIADVGFGVSQTLPVLVALRAAAHGRVVYLEQPEIHLHPKAQASLARVIAQAAKRGIVVVVETHSAILLRSIQTLVALGELQPADVSLNWFSRDPGSGATQIARSTPDERGAYGAWPEDFDDTLLKVERDYLEAIERRVSA